MNQVLFALGLCNIIVGLVCIGLSVPLLRGRVKMNRWYGVRIPKAFSSEDNWYRINQYGSKALIYWCIPIILLGVIMLVGSFFTDEEILSPWWYIPFYLTGLLLLGALFQTLIWSKRLP
ncbi:MAG: SdpI family protein [Verrucomicrobiales bacterium]